MCLGKDMGPFTIFITIGNKRLRKTNTQEVHMRTFFQTVLFIVLLAGPALMAQPQQDTLYLLSPVEVTATYATPRLTPVTFSDYDRQEIRRTYSTQDIPVLLSELPSVIFYSENGNGLGYNYINLRGFDQRRLSVMINGIPQNDPEDHNVYWIDFPDLLASTTALQLQRGAGSAFYGPPAIGGSVNIIAVPFHQTPGASVETMFGFQEYGSTGSIVLSTQKYTATFNSGVVDNRYMFYGRVGKIQTTGYRDKSWAELSSYFFGIQRLDETMTTRLHFYGGPLQDGLVYNGLPKFYNIDKKLRRKNYSYFELNNSRDAVTYATERRPQEVESFSQPHFEILHDWKLTPEITLYNTLFYIQGDGYYDFDGSWADTTTLRIGSAYGFPTNDNPTNTLIRAFVGNKQVGWLPRVEFTRDGKTIIVGAELRRHRSTHWGKIRYAENLPVPYDPDYRFYEYNGAKDIASAFVHTLLPIANRTTLMFDVQFVYNRYAIENEKYLGNNFSYSYFFVNPRLGVNYNIDENLNSYVTVASTTREPRLKNLYEAEGSYYGSTPLFEADTSGGIVKYDFSKPLVKPEHLVDIEAGISYHSANVVLAANVFWMEFYDELIKKGQVDIFGQPITGNAERTRHIGMELEGRWFVGRGLSVSGNATVMKNRLVRYSVFQNSGSGTTRISLDGNPIAGSPEYLFNIAIQYEKENFYTALKGKYVGEFYTDNTKNPLLKNDAYWVWNAVGSVQLPVGNGITCALRGEVRNLFNALYTMNGEGEEFFPAAERNYVIGVTFTF